MTTKRENTNKNAMKVIELREGIEEKVNQKMKSKLDCAQGSTDWNKILIRNFEERQENKQESTFAILRMRFRKAANPSRRSTPPLREAFRVFA